MTFDAEAQGRREMLIKISATLRLGVELFIPTAAGMQFEVDREKPAAMAAWQAQFVKGGTRHGFKNLGNSTVTIMEIFVKK